jgi:hypothetical protein
MQKTVSKKHRKVGKDYRRKTKNSKLKKAHRKRLKRVRR